MARAVCEKYRISSLDCSLALTKEVSYAMGDTFLDLPTELPPLPPPCPLAGLTSGSNLLVLSNLQA